MSFQGLISRREGKERGREREKGGRGHSEPLPYVLKFLLPFNEIQDCQNSSEGIKKGTGGCCLPVPIQSAEFQATLQMRSRITDAEKSGK